jgi:glycosyltransferase involved in cell wall biosynthesis
VSGARRVTLVGLLAGGHSGVPRYAACLARALDEVSAEFPELSLSLLTTKRGADAVGARSIEVRTLRLDASWLNRGPGRIAAEQLAVRSAPADLLHFFDLTGPLLAPRRPFVATAHDLSLLHGYGRVLQVHKRKLIPWAARRARAIVSISQFTKDELVRLLRVDPGKVTVIRSGPGLGTSAEPETPGRTPPQAPYLLFVGNLTDSKNLPFLIRAFDRAGDSARLVLAGRPLERYGDIVQAIESSPRRAQIHVLHDATDADVERLYAAATAVVLPSRYEGFGLTALEAMQRGCPVLASDIPALREISGQGAELLPVDDERAWSDAIRRVLSDDGYRAELRARGARAVSRYSWERTARELCATLRDVPLPAARR